jgi:hypothetical protein
VVLAQLLSGSRLDPHGALDPVSPADQSRALAELRTRYPAEFSVAPERVPAWHCREAEKYLRRWGDPAAAMFHFRHTSPVWPLPPELPQR